MALIHLIYTSTMVENAPAVMTDILQTARHINQQRDITGMLLYANSSILQVLEGADADVSKTFASIETDKRHKNVFVLAKGPIQVRQFAQWDMGFKHLNQSDFGQSPIAAQVFNADKDQIAKRVKPGAALTMLVLFAHGVEVVE